MGITNLCPWLTGRGYNPTIVTVRPGDSLAVDAKLFMTKLMHTQRFEVNDDRKLAADVALAMHDTFKEFAPRVTFVNDGTVVPVLKVQTLEKRRQAQDKACESMARAQLELDTLLRERKPDGESALERFAFDLKRAKLEKTLATKQRQAHGMSKKLAMEILEILEQTYGYCVIQCEGEADAMLAHIARDYTYVVTEDTDMIAYGVDNLLRMFGTQNLLYRGVLAFLNMSLREFQEMICLSGCDYCTVKGISLQKGYDFIKKYGTAERFLQSADAVRFGLPDSFVSLIADVVTLFEAPMLQTPAHRVSGTPICAVGKAPAHATAQESVAQESVAQEPVAQEPVAQEPVAQEPPAQEPAAQEPPAQESVAQEPPAQDASVREAYAPDCAMQEAPDHVLAQAVDATRAHEAEPAAKRLKTE